jgi:glutamine amidotransferase PdxT
MSDVTLNPRVFGKNTMRVSRVKRSAGGAVKAIRTELLFDSLIFHSSSAEVKQRDHQWVVNGTCNPLILSFKELNIQSSELVHVPPKRPYYGRSRKSPETAEEVNERML